MIRINKLKNSLVFSTDRKYCDVVYTCPRCENLLANAMLYKKKIDREDVAIYGDIFINYSNCPYCGKKFRKIKLKEKSDNIEEELYNYLNEEIFGKR